MEDLRYQEVLDRLSALKASIAWLKPSTDDGSVKDRPTLKDVVALVCVTYGINRNELISHRKMRHIVWPRHVAMYLGYNLTLHSLPSLGRYFAGFDHSSICHARKRVARLRQEKPEVEAELRKLEILLGQG